MNKQKKYYHQTVKTDPVKMNERRKQVREAKRRFDMKKKKTPEELSTIRSKTGVLGAIKRWQR